MKTKITIWSLAVLTVVSLLSSCSMFNTDDSGKLGGYWHLTRIDTLSTGGVKDMSESPIFYSVQGAIFEVKNVNTTEYLMFRYAHNGSSLQLSDARYNQREMGDPPITDIEVLKPYGINKLDELFIIEQLDSKHMVLISEMLKLSFDKF